jgi:hypothetical protein
MPLRRRDANAKQLNVRMPPDELKSTKFAATSPSRRAEAQGFEAVLLAGKNRVRA